MPAWALAAARTSIVPSSCLHARLLAGYLLPHLWPNGCQNAPASPWRNCTCLRRDLPVRDLIHIPIKSTQIIHPIAGSTKWKVLFWTREIWNVLFYSPSKINRKWFPWITFFVLVPRLLSGGTAWDIWSSKEGVQEKKHCASWPYLGSWLKLTVTIMRVYRAGVQTHTYILMPAKGLIFCGTPGWLYQKKYLYCQWAAARRAHTSRGLLSDLNPMLLFHLKQRAACGFYLAFVFSHKLSDKGWG